MNKSLTLVSMTVIVIFLIIFSNLAVISGVANEKVYTENFLENFDNIDKNDLSFFQQKRNQDEEILGWKLGDLRSDISVPGFTITAICVGLSENIVVLIESTLQDQFTEVRGNNIAEEFQTKIYNPTAESLGIPKESEDFPGSHDIALIIVDSTERVISWGSIYGSGQQNGYEAICTTEDVDLISLTTRYQACVYRSLRSIDERWFLEGMSEFWPVYLGLTTSNRCSDIIMDALESSHGQNIALLEFLNYGTTLGAISYGISFAFVFYIYEQFGIDFISDVVKDSNLSISQSINNQLSLLGYANMDFKDVFFNFQMALRLNKEKFDPKWGFHGLNFNIPIFDSNNADSLPLDIDFLVYHWAGETHRLSLNEPSFSALKYTFNGSSAGDFDVHVIGSSFYNYSYTEEVVSHMTINNETQDGELIFILPNKVANVYINMVNANGPETGYSVSTVEEYGDLRDSASIKIETFDPGLVGSIVSLEYTDRSFNITAEVDWDLDTSLVENDLAPHIVLYDADGEFAFNLRSNLAYDEDTDKWVGQLDISEDIKAGKYNIKLFVRGVELDSEEGSVSGTSAIGFMFFPMSVALVSLIYIRRRRESI